MGVILRDVSGWTSGVRQHSPTSYAGARWWQRERFLVATAQFFTSLPQSVNILSYFARVIFFKNNHKFILSLESIPDPY